METPAALLCDAWTGSYAKVGGLEIRRPSSFKVPCFKFLFGNFNLLCPLRFEGYGHVSTIYTVVKWRTRIHVKYTARVWQEPISGQHGTSSTIAAPLGSSRGGGRRTASRSTVSTQNFEQRYADVTYPALDTLQTFERELDTLAKRCNHIVGSQSGPSKMKYSTVL